MRTAGTLTALAFGAVAWTVFFTKTKKDWLTINAGDNSAIVQLQSDNYRMLLLAMRSKGIKITDFGDRDAKIKGAKNSNKKAAKIQTPAKN